MKAQYDVIVIGSGINALVCAALASKKGQSVLLLERSDHFGGCIRSGEITLPGFTHDLLSSWYPLFLTSPGYALLQNDLEKHGLVFCHTTQPSASIDSVGNTTILTTNRDNNIAEFNKLAEGSGDAYLRGLQDIEHNAELIFYLFSNQLWNFSMLSFLGRYLFKNRRTIMQFVPRALQSTQSWIERDLQNQQLGNLVAPWVLHTGLAPSATMSALMAKLIFFTLEAVGMPVVKGGSDNLVKAFISLLQNNGADCIANADVEQILAKNNQVEGVKLKDGTTYFGTKVVANVSVDQLYQRLLPQTPTSQSIVNGYRYGRGAMQIHIALKEPPKWQDERLNQVAMVHLCDDVYAVNQACNEAQRGYLPAHATIVVGQPCTVDSTRAPEGQSILWIQLQEVPFKPVADSLGEIDVGDGRWTEELKQAYVQRILSRLYKHIANLEEVTEKVVAYSPQDLSQMNINLVNGDPYCGDCAIDQFFVFRPSSQTRNHKTSIKNLYQVGAMTHPGPGLGGTSGYLVAEKYL